MKISLARFYIQLVKSRRVQKKLWMLLLGVVGFTLGGEYEKWNSIKTPRYLRTLVPSFKGSQLSLKNMKLTSFEEGKTPQQALTDQDFNLIENHFLKRDLPAGSWILSSDLIGTGKGGEGKGISIGKGMRAVLIEIEDSSHLHRGDFVDIWLVSNPTQSTEPIRLLEQVEVLYTDVLWDKKVLVSVFASEVWTLEKAKRMGKLSLSVTPQVGKRKKNGKGAKLKTKKKEKVEVWK